MNTTFTKTISIRDVYGTDTPEIPKGYKAVDFRLARRGECYAGYNGYWFLACVDHDTATAIPYIILSKIPDPIIIKKNVENTLSITVDDIYSTDVTIPEGYEFVDFRAPKSGEIFINSARAASVCVADFSPTKSTDSRIIIKKCS